MQLFPPMGTKPIKRGIIVPDDFELPPGYVRHFQSTDDGERLPAILMFSPDYEWVDAQGRPVPCPPIASCRPSWRRPDSPSSMLEPPAPKVPPDGTALSRALLAATRRHAAERRRARSLRPHRVALDRARLGGARAVARGARSRALAARHARRRRC